MLLFQIKKFKDNDPNTLRLVLECLKKDHINLLEIHQPQTLLLMYMLKAKTYIPVR